ncbi:unnamed protein product, partial [Choristocarpus tenellus]
GDTELNLRGRRLQVIVKAVNYILAPGQTHEGVWHVEGTPQEHIIASVLFYYHVSPALTGDGLAFRRCLTEDEEETLVERFTHDFPPNFDYSTSVIQLGTVETPQGRVIAFPNTHQHRLCPITNNSRKVRSNSAQRKLLCFFIVNPNVRVKSTADVPDQNWDHNRVQGVVALQAKARRVIGGRGLPEDVVRHVLTFAKQGMTLEEAKRVRLNLMKDRKYLKDSLNRWMEREISLCEH